MTSSRPLTTIDTEETEVNDVSLDNLDIRGESRNCNREKNLLLRRRSRRWLLKEKKKSKEQLLLRAQRMAQHKLVTSQTDLSRERFQNQIAAIKARIKKLCLPPPLGHLLPFGLSKEAERRSNGVARGRGLWCSLDKRVVAASSKMTTHRMIPHTHPAPDNLPEVLQEGLEIRAVEEARLLLQAIRVESRNDTFLQRPLVRRLRGQEVRSLVMAGKMAIKDDEVANYLACFLCSGGSIALSEGGPPMYDLDTVFADESRRIAFQSLLRDVAIIMNKKYLKIKRSLKLPQYTLPDASSAHEKTAQAVGDLDRRQKMPRLHLIRQDERTVNLCIALWRLNAWSLSL